MKEKKYFFSVTYKFNKDNYVHIIKYQELRWTNTK